MHWSKVSAMPVILPADRCFNLYWLSLFLIALSTWVVLLSAAPVLIKLLLSSVLIYSVYSIYQKLMAQNECVIELKSYDQWQCRLSHATGVTHDSLILENYWQFPELVFLRLKSSQQTFFMLVRRSIIGAEDFSRIITAIKQHETQ